MNGTTGGNYTFLGREFLTWLWHKSEERNGVVNLPGQGDIGVIFLRRIVFESGEGEFAETVSCQGFRTDLKEGKAALRQGKKIREARLRLSIGTADWEFTFNADNFRFQSLSLPAGPEEKDDSESREARLLDRIGMTEEAVATMEKLFAYFLEKRLSGQWQTEEIPRFDKWLRN
ncbi:MAG: hypothetical protein JW884_00980 [Deltaproteobacteria bacterium]|nr:hypothetical protein [Deltaproteobacteria bacterium]